MKELTLYKIGIGMFCIWQGYYTYWWFSIYKELKKND